MVDADAGIGLSAEDRDGLCAFGAETRPDAAALVRLRVRIAASIESTAVFQGWLVGRLKIAVPVAAVAVLALVLVLPQNQALPLPGEPPLALTSETDPAQIKPTREVRLEYQGAGELGGTREAPRLAWRTGTVRAEVEPDRGIDLTVETPEATVRVIGTVFEVTRGALGTETRVERGIVRVDCSLGTKAILEPGEHTTCWPSTAAGLLGRARRLQESSADPVLALQALDLALGRPDAEGPVLEEIGWVRVEILAESGRRRAALDEARRLLLAGGGHRHDELLAAIDRLARWSRSRR